MKTTRYFEEKVLAKRPYLKREWCEQVVRNPERYELQEDGRIRFWAFVPELGKYLRVIHLKMVKLYLMLSLTETIKE